MNGFTLHPTIINTNAIFSGGPPKDGIPSINNPVFHTAESDTFLHEDDRILGLVIGDTAKAYPVRILNWHEIVNDTFGSTPVAITYCPLCGTGAAFHAEIAGSKLEFGVSGLLYNSDVLLYDRQTESLWSQIRAEGVTGAFAGTALQQLPLVHTSWKSWKTNNPNTRVLSDDTGFLRDYSRNPYAGYDTSEKLYFPVEFSSEIPLHPKETVLGVEVGNTFKAYPFSALAKFGKIRFEDTIGNEAVTIQWDAEGYSATARGTTNNKVSFMQGFWFAWYAFHPETEVFQLP